MDLVMYANSSEPEKIGKSLSELQTYSIRLKERSSVMNPVVTITSATYPVGNYAYISEFGRYYFVSDIVSVANGLWEVSLKCDPLESFKEQLLNNDCILERQEFMYNLHLEDDQLKMQDDTFVITKQFSQGLNYHTLAIAHQ